MGTKKEASGVRLPRTRTSVFCLLTLVQRRAGFKLGDLVKMTVKEEKKNGGFRFIERTFRITKAELPQGKSSWVYCLEQQDLTGTTYRDLEGRTTFTENSLKLAPPPART